MSTVTGRKADPKALRAMGKKQRERFPRSRAASWAKSDRRDPISWIKQDEQGRDPDALLMRHKRMSESPFFYLRGTASVMARDLLGTPATSFTVQLCGDAHVGNFGIYTSKTVDDYAFGIVDFDETEKGHWEWDIKRLAVSGAIVLDMQGKSSSIQQRAIDATLKSYQKTIRKIAKLTPEERDLLTISSKKLLKHIPESGITASGGYQAKDPHGQILQIKGNRIIDVPPHIIHVDDKQTALVIELYNAYYADMLHDFPDIEDWRIVDIARRIAGVGSMGLCNWVILLKKGDVTQPIILREARQSAIDVAQDTPILNPARRVSIGMDVMQIDNDPFIGWIDDKDRLPRFYYVKSLPKWHNDLVHTLQSHHSVFIDYLKLCAKALAQSHVRAYYSHADVVAGYLGKSASWRDACAVFCRQYVDQVKKDYDAYCKAVDNGIFPIK